MWFIPTQNNVYHTTSLGIDGLHCSQLEKSADTSSISGIKLIGGVSVDCSSGVGIPAILRKAIGRLGSVLLRHQMSAIGRCRSMVLHKNKT